MNYKLELKQIVEFPRCRIYRDFIQTLITTKSIRTTGGSFLFYYLVYQRNNADDQCTELEQLRVCNHRHPSFPEGKRMTYPS